MAITVTTPAGNTLPGIDVTVMGVTERNGTTNDSGQLNFPGMQIGNYRVRFAGDGVITLERDVTVVRGQVLQVDVALNPAPKPPPPPPAPAPAPAPVDAAQGGKRTDRAAAVGFGRSRSWRRNSSGATRAGNRCCRAAAPRAAPCCR